TGMGIGRPIKQVDADSPRLERAWQRKTRRLTCPAEAEAMLSRRMFVVAAHGFPCSGPRPQSALEVIHKKGPKIGSLRHGRDSRTSQRQRLRPCCPEPHRLLVDALELASEALAVAEEHLVHKRK